MENILLKSGFNNLESNDSNEEIKLQMTALITVFMENAMKTAEIYTKEANRKVITPQDILDRHLICLQQMEYCLITSRQEEE